MFCGWFKLYCVVDWNRRWLQSSSSSSPFRKKSSHRASPRHRQVFEMQHNQHHHIIPNTRVSHKLFKTVVPCTQPFRELWAMCLFKSALEENDRLFSLLPSFLLLKYHDQRKWIGERSETKRSPLMAQLCMQKQLMAPCFTRVNTPVRHEQPSHRTLTQTVKFATSKAKLNSSSLLLQTKVNNIYEEQWGWVNMHA